MRQKVFAAWQAGEGSQEQVAARLRVSRRCAGDLSALFGAGGSLAGRPRSGRHLPLLRAAVCLEAKPSPFQGWIIY